MSYSPLNAPVVRRGRNPLELVVLGFVLASGIAGLFGESSRAVVQMLGEYVWAWNVGVIAGSATALIGVLTLKPLNDVLVERVGMIWLATCWTLYAIALCLADDAFFSLAAGTAIGMAIGSAARAWQISKDLKRLRKVLEELPAREVTEPKQ